MTVAKRKAGIKAGPWVAAAVAVIAIGVGTAWYQGQQSSSRQDESARAKAAADAEIAKARAEADEARKAAASAAAAADAARRALEEQRLAETRAREKAELTAARAEIDTTRRKAEAELASATKARRAAEEEAAQRKAEAEAALATAKAAAKPAPAKPAAAPVAAQAAASAPPQPAPVKWAGTFACGSVGPAGPASFPAAGNSLGAAFELSYGKAGQPGSLQMKGTRQPDGRLSLSGSGMSGLAHVKGQTYSASLEGKFTGENYEGRGKMGDRDCVLSLLTEAAAKRQAADQLAAYPGPWTASVACASLSTLPPNTYLLGAKATGARFEVFGGKQGEPGSVMMSGQRKADGGMRLEGKGIASNKEFRGQTFQAGFEGRFSGERFEGRGKFGTRDCALSIARR